MVQQSILHCYAYRHIIIIMFMSCKKNRMTLLTDILNHITGYSH